MKITRKTFDEVMFPCYNPMNMVIKKAHGAYIYDNKGNKYTDLTSGIAVNLLGHTPKGVVDVIKKASANLIHVSNIFCIYTKTAGGRFQFLISMLKDAHLWELVM